MPIADPATYMKLPSGTRVLFGALADATADLKLLKDANAVGTTGKTAGFVDATRLIDVEEKSIADMPVGEEKEFVFYDDTTDSNLQALLAAAESNESVKLRIEYPNGRWADMVIVLSGWKQQEPVKGEPLKLAVTGKQNGIERGYAAP
jgi:hypothetical protein